jgi:hypothetical protein
VHPGTGDRHDPRHRPGRGPQPSQPGQHRPSHRVRQLIDRSPHGEQLLGKEGVAPRSDVNPVGQLLRRVVAPDRGNQLGGLVARERRQVDALHPGGGAQLPQQPPQRTGGRDLLAAIGAHEHQPLRAQHPGTEHDQITGRRIGPVQVLHDHEVRRRSRTASQPVGHRAKESQSIAGLRPEEQLGAQHLHERPVGERLSQRQARTLQHGHRLAPGPLDRIGHQAGLAHPRLPRDQHQPGPVRTHRRHRPPEPRTLLGPPHEHRARHSTRHVHSLLPLPEPRVVRARAWPPHSQEPTGLPCSRPPPGCSCR